LQKEGWRIVQDGVLRRELTTNKIETFVFGEAGFSWKLRDLRAQLEVLRREFQAHPTPELRRAIESHGKLIASTLTMTDRARAADASRESKVLKSGCPPPPLYSANASYKTDHQGTWAVALAEFDASAGCNASGEVYAYAFAKTAMNGVPSTATVTDGPKSGSNVTASADANRDGGADCESYAYASVTSDSLSPTSYSIAQTNESCPAVNPPSPCESITSTAIQAVIDKIAASRAKAESDVAAHGTAGSPSRPGWPGYPEAATNNLDYLTLARDHMTGMLDWLRSIGMIDPPSFLYNSAGAYNVTIYVRETVSFLHLARHWAGISVMYHASADARDSFELTMQALELIEPLGAHSRGCWLEPYSILP
jgi:hypothetical protein